MQLNVVAGLRKFAPLLDGAESMLPEEGFGVINRSPRNKVSNEEKRTVIWRKIAVCDPCAPNKAVIESEAHISRQFLNFLENPERFGVAFRGGTDQRTVQPKA